MKIKVNLFLFSKKAVSTTTFTWIFIIIIGGILISVAYSLLQSYWAIETEASELEFLTALSSTFNVKSQSLNAQSGTKLSSFPILSQKNINLQCIEGEFLRLSIDNREKSYEPLDSYLDSYPVMMPQLIDEEPNSIYLIQEDYYLPLTITSLIGVVPKHHIIVIDDSSNMHNVIIDLTEKRGSFKQLSFQSYDSDSTIPNYDDVFIEDILDKNPSSITFVGFSQDFQNNVIKPSFDNRGSIAVYHIESTFSNLPIILDSNNEEGYVSGNLKFTYSNQNEDFDITNQDNVKDPINFRFYGLDNQVSMLTYSLFSPPNVYECSHNSIRDRSEFQYNFAIQKIDLILSQPTLAGTYCNEFANEDDVRAFYEILKTQFITINTAFDESTDTNTIKNSINIIESAHNELRRQDCELIY